MLTSSMDALSFSLCFDTTSMAHRDAVRVRAASTPSPSMAANQLGLSTQVPSKPTYMTDGPTRTKKVGRQVIQFRKASPKTLVGAGHKTGVVFQALRYVGKDHVDSQIVDQIARALDDNDRKLLVKQSRHVPAWMHPIVQQIVERR
ncbi:DUF6088 family protein [Amaricoccus tamworthensis]|uniref:DUF6088 family protein n=1 Tax=Amaricoccus tamworthensis TaxID=57002 RepID=UPI003C7DF22E